MPNLPDCGPDEWRSLLPGVAPPVRPARRAQKGASSCSQGVDSALLQAYRVAIRRQVDRGVIPGFCCLALWRDRVLHVDAYGHADLERGTPFRTDSIVRLYCMSKTLVATGLMVLVDRGQCSLEDEVRNFIPSFADARVAASEENSAPSPQDLPAGDGMTLRRLLTHTAGLGYGKEFNLPPESPAERSYLALVNRADRGEVPSLAAFCDEMAALPLRHRPGARFEYSYGLDVISRVIEVVSGQALEQFMEESLFAPLGMRDTGFYVPAEKLPRLAALYGSHDTATWLGEASSTRPAPKIPSELVRLDGQTPSESRWAKPNVGPVIAGGGMMGHNGGGLVSTLNDQARFFLMVARGGQLSPEVHLDADDAPSSPERRPAHPAARDREADG